ncbi:hypothetical protein BDM02DRAFT_3118225 [Thelephora ganbajun]|uniref:Uncharacterized protein n=1 Tax=Thelephora ganbajun TaxID=370292 RepID=A0ACB6ZBJ8_THEGA|nr:hypothetical protein BDM02DRAFT_3118225 [Thelephora ganbajun]
MDTTVLDHGSNDNPRNVVPLCPRKLIVRSLYKLYARSLTRIVHGLLNSWESMIVQVRKNRRGGRDDMLWFCEFRRVPKFMGADPVFS